MATTSEQLQLLIDVQVQGEKALKDTAKNIENLEKGTIKGQAGASRLSKGMGILSTQAKIAGVAMAGGLTVGIGAATRSAITFESAFAGIRKTLTATEPEYEALRQNIIGLSKEIPVSASELAGIGEIAGQLGVEGVDNMTGFIDSVAKIAVTTNLSQEAAATAFARISNITGEPIENIDRMASSVVDLGNNFAANESEIVGFTNNIASAGKLANLTTADMFGISTAFTAVGIEAEAGGTAVSKVLQGITKEVITGGDKVQKFAEVAGVSADEFATIWKQDAAKGFELFVQGLDSSGQNAIGVLEDLELSDVRLQKAFLGVSQESENLVDAIDLSNKAFGENNALAKEADERFKTTESSIQLVKNNFSALGLELTEGALPAIRDFSQFLIDNQDTIKDFGEKGLQIASEAFTFLKESAEKAQPGIEGFVKAGQEIFDIFTNNEGVVSGFVTGGIDVLIEGFNALGKVTGEVFEFLDDNEAVIIALGAAFAGVKIAGFATELGKVATKASASATALGEKGMSGALASLASSAGPAAIGLGIGLVVGAMKDISDKKQAVQDALGDMEQAFIDVGLAPERAARRMLEFAELQAEMSKVMKEGTVEDLQALKQKFDDFENEPLMAPEKATAIIKGFRDTTTAAKEAMLEEWKTNHVGLEMGVDVQEEDIVAEWEAAGGASVASYLQTWEGLDPANKINESILASMTQQSAQMGDVGAFVGAAMAEGLTADEALSTWNANGQTLTNDFINEFISNPEAYGEAGVVAVSGLSRGLVSAESITAMQDAGFQLNDQSLAALTQGNEEFLTSGEVKGALVAQGMGGEDAQAMVDSAAGLLNEGALLELSDKQLQFLNSGVLDADLFASGMIQQAPTAQAAGGTVAGAGNAGLLGKAAEFSITGSSEGSAYATAVGEKAGAAQTAGTNVATAGNQGLVNQITTFAQSGSQGGSAFVAGVTGTSGAAKTAGTATGTAAGQGTQAGMTSSVSGQLSPIMGAEMTAVETAGNNASPSFSGITSGFSSAISGISGQWQTAINSLSTPSLPAPPGNASGTAFFGGGATMVGERGPELAVLPQGSRIFNNVETRRMEREASNETNNNQVSQEFNTTINSNIEVGQFLNLLRDAVTPS